VPHKICRRAAVRRPLVSYKPTCLTAVTSHCFARSITWKSALNSCMRQTAYHRNNKCIFKDLLPCYCCATKANSRKFAPAIRNLPLQQCCQLNGFPHNWAVFFVAMRDFFTVAGCVFWVSFIKMHAVFWAVFSKDYSIKEYSFCQFC